jgi:hypothetical protein
MNKTIYTIIVVALVGGALGFWGGMIYANNSAKTARETGMSNFQNLTAAQRVQVNMRRGGQGGGSVAGDIISKDDKSITVKSADGGSKLIFFSTSTRVTKFAEGNIEDVAVGAQVVINGIANSDGSITAQAIQIRPTVQ